MKKTISVLLLFMAFVATSQNLTNSLNAFKSKDIDSVMKLCSLPFDLSAGSLIDDNKIVETKVLREKLNQLFKKKYFDSFFKGKRIVDDSKKMIQYEHKSFDKNGELESESTLMFFFKKVKDGSFKLYSITMAG